MLFTDKILKYNSCSIVGMAKNCGKTVVLNYILSCLQKAAVRIAVTSIGLDGEKQDIVTLTAKPEIILDKGTLFATSESFYSKRQLISQIVDSTDYWSPLGKILIGDVLEKGKVIISGPSDMHSTKSLIDLFHKLGADLVLIDGALSRKTSASPVVTESLILCTGAALSLSTNELINQTAFTHELISIPPIKNDNLMVSLNNIENGVWGITTDGEMIKGADTVFDLKDKLPGLLASFDRLFFSGILINSTLESIIPKIKNKEIIVRDFTKIFVTPQSFNRFIKARGTIRVLHKTELIGVCVNPVSPTGHILCSEELVDKLQQRLEVGVYDVKRIC